MGHISDAGTIRLAKAMWWMLARIAGWDGGIQQFRLQILQLQGLEDQQRSQRITAHFS